MAYRTYYNFDTKINLTMHSFEKLVSDLRESCEEARYALTKDGTTNEETSWYEHEDDLKLFSKKYPSIVFELNGTGEETFDIWTKYFKNGRMQFCPIITSFDPYDEDKLE